MVKKRHQKNLTIILVIIFTLSYIRSAHADLAFPAISHQFAVSMVIPAYYSIVLAVLILFIEGYFIKEFLLKSWIYGFGVSFLINLFSSILGIFITSFLEVMTRGICKGIFGYNNMRLGTYIGMIPGYGLTVLVEWLMLLCWVKCLCKNKFEPKNLFILSSKMNFFSYLILLAGIFIADVMTKGQNFRVSS